MQTGQFTRDGMAAANKLSARFNSLRPFATRGEAVEGATWGFVTMVRQAQLSPKSIIDRRLTNSRRLTCNGSSQTSGDGASSLAQSKLHGSSRPAAHVTTWKWRWISTMGSGCCAISILGLVTRHVKSLSPASYLVPQPAQLQNIRPMSS